jgi:hypothetical protein
VVEASEGYKLHFVFTSPGKYGRLPGMPVNGIHPDQFGTYEFGLYFVGGFAATKCCCYGEKEELFHGLYFPVLDGFRTVIQRSYHQVFIFIPQQFQKKCNK